MRKILLLLTLCSNLALAHRFDIPTNGSDVVGQWKMVTILPGDSINTIAYNNDTSGARILLANPDIQEIDKIRINQNVLLPTCYQLPKVHEGIVVNLAEHTLFYFPNNKQVWAFPVTIGKDVTPTPLGVFKVIKKSMNPPWFPPENIRAKFAKRGITLPKKMPPGPKNPLGKYVLYLNTPQYWIHTTPNISELGGNRSFGCVRMYQKDIQQLYENVPLDTPVRIISQPVRYLTIAKQCLPSDHQIINASD